MAMRKGRELLGLPVFSYRDDLFLGRVVDLCLDRNIRGLSGLMLQKRGISRKCPTIAATDILKIYDDGIIVRNRGALKRRSTVGAVPIYYSSFLDEAELPGSEGELIADIFFDERYFVVGFEISSGFWSDLQSGRGFYPRKEEDKPWGMQKNGR